MRNRIIALVIAAFAIAGITAPAVLAATPGAPAAVTHGMIYWE